MPVTFVPIALNPTSPVPLPELVIVPVWLAVPEIVMPPAVAPSFLRVRPPVPAMLDDMVRSPLWLVNVVPAPFTVKAVVEIVKFDVALF